MRRLAVAASVLATFAAAGCSGDGAEAQAVAEDPRVFVTTLVHDVAAGRYGAAWEHLYPPHQQVATRTAYLRCEPLTPFPGRISSLEVRRVWLEPVRISGRGQDMSSTAVRLRLTVRSASRAAERFETTFHVVDVDGHWKWFLPSVRYVAYREGRCLTDG
jgi:hypothetical protein